MSAIEKYQPNISEIQTWAEKFAESGMFTDARQVVQAFVKISAGAELGLTPFQSMSGVHIIQGKPVVGAGLLASLLDRDPAYDYRVEWEPDEAHPEACTVIVIKNGNERGRSRFSLEDAKRAGLTSSNWTKYPSSMLFARAMSNAVRWYAPGATGTSVYVEGELEPSTAQPARVTASVQRFTDPISTPEEHVEGEVIDATTKALLTSMSAFDKAELYQRTAIEKGSRLDAVKSSLCSAYIEWEWIKVGEPCPDEPDPVAVLAEFRRLDRENTPGDAVDTFDHFARTGQDLAEDPQTAIV